MRRWEKAQERALKQEMITARAEGGNDKGRQPDSGSSSGEAGSRNKLT